MFMLAQDGDNGHNYHEEQNLIMRHNDTTTLIKDSHDHQNS